MSREIREVEEQPRERLTDLDIQTIYLVHPRTEQCINSFGLRWNISDDGSSVEITFPFVEGKNEELTHVLFGVDYEISHNKEVATPIDINIDGTYSCFPGIPIQIVSVDNAVAVAGNQSLRVKKDVQDGDAQAIAFCFITNRFIRSPDLKNRQIRLYRAEAVYPRWVEISTKAVRTKEGGVDVLNEKERPLEEIDLYLFTKENGSKFHRRYKATVPYVAPDQRKHAILPGNARRIRLEGLDLTHRQELKCE